MMTPTTLGAAAGQVQPGRSKTPFVIAAVATVVLAAVGVFVLAGRKGSTEPAASPDTGSDTTIALGSGSAEQGSQDEVTPPDTQGSATAQGSATTPPNTQGSATTPPDTQGSATTPPDTQGSATTPPKNVIRFSAVTITSNPPGAEILINSTSIGKQTPATLNLPVGKDVVVTLKLSGHADYRKSLAIKGETVSLDVPLRKVRTRHADDGNKGDGNKGKGSGSNSGTKKLCDTCLERPD